MKSISHSSIVIAVLAAQLIAGLGSASASEPADPFPTYPCLTSNVAFWKKVYTVYSTSQGVLHDRRDLDIIYEVIPLREAHRAGAARYNAGKVNQIKKKYERLLRALAAGKAPASDEEKRIHSMFVDAGSRRLLKDAHLNVRYQLGQKDRFRSGLIRSGAYLNEIKQVFRKYGLPEDLAYLPHVESSFDYEAYSKFGAAGIWQFTHGTGKRFMTIDYTVDERRDPIRATHAAARFLKENYEALGNWPMAITAYNHGTSGMLRAQRIKGGYESIFKEYDGRSFGFASRNFYSEFLAAREIAKNHHRYFGNLELAKPMRRHSVQVPGYASVHDLARRFQVKEKTLREYNPSLREPVFKGQKYVPKGFLLHLPEKAASSPAYLAEIPAEMLKSRQKPSRFYRVHKGDTASEIAKQHRVDLKDLIAANGLNSRATVYAGQNLRIPGQGEKIMVASASAPRLAPAAEPTVSRAKETSTEKPLASSPPAKTALPAKETEPAPVSEPIPAPASPPVQISTPVPEPAPAALATSTPVSEPAPAAVATSTPVSEPAPAAVATSTPVSEPAPAAVATSTPVSEPALAAVATLAPVPGTEPGSEAEEPDQTLLDSSRKPLEEALQVNPAVVVGNFSVEKVFARNGKEFGVIQVEPEETLGHYADWLQIPTQEIRNLNRFSFKKSIHVGQRIEIPFGTITREQFEENRYEYHKEIEEDFFAAYAVERLTTYRIERGDNVWTLCKERFDLPFWLLKKYNPEMDSDRLVLAQPLVIPVVSKIGEESGPTVPEHNGDETGEENNESDPGSMAQSDGA